MQAGAGAGAGFAAARATTCSSLLAKLENSDDVFGAGELARISLMALVNSDLFASDKLLTICSI